VRPFARDREGLKLGEGYGIVVLERAVDAQRRGASLLANIVGLGESCDAFHLSQPHPEGRGASSAMTAALAAAAISPDDIDLIAAHATATPNNDAAEFTAMSRVFGDKLKSIPIVAFKTHLGHTLGGAGAVELILTAMALRQQVVPPCAHATDAEVEFQGLRLALGDAVRAPLGHSLNTSLGFGGSNMCAVLARADRSPTLTQSSTENSHPSADRDVFITGIGVVFPGAVGNDAFTAHLARDPAKGVTEDTGGVADADGPGGLDIGHLLQARRVRRMSEYAKLSLAATTLAYRDAGIDDIAAFGESCSAVLGTMHGSSNYCERYYRRIVEEGIAAANPILFAEGVPNAGGAHLSTMLSIKGLCQTVIGTRTAGLDAVRLATARIRSGDWERAVVSVSDEYAPLVNRAYAHFGLYRSAGADLAHGKRGTSRLGFVTGCGAVTLILESRSAAAQRNGSGARARGVVQATASAFTPALATRAGAESLSRVLAQIGQPSYVMGSANDTWLDRIEGAALRRAGGRLAIEDSGLSISKSAILNPQSSIFNRPPIVSSIYGHVAECFSVLPMAGLAAVLLSGRMPRCLTPRVPGVRAACGDERPDSIGILCTDYNGMISGIRIRLVEHITDSTTL
ncbi:MAG: hypothetical protein IID43_02495, partial [Planctomycetes bacterium]|nr:hypothetical protein [Planctomycetota bacterium]